MLCVWVDQWENDTCLDCLYIRLISCVDVMVASVQSTSGFSAGNGSYESATIDFSSRTYLYLSTLQVCI